METVSREAVVQVHREHFPQRQKLFRRGPDRDKVIAILEEIDFDHSATLGENEAALHSSHALYMYVPLLYAVFNQ